MLTQSTVYIKLHSNNDYLCRRFDYRQLPKSYSQQDRGESNYETIKQLEELLIGNVSSTQSEIGGGNHEYLGLALKPSKHTIVTGSAFTPHNNPGAVPVFPANPI